MKYRELLTLTDEEITFILKDIFSCITKIENIQRDEKYNEITCDITTNGWNDGETEDLEITDEMVLTENGFDVDFMFGTGDVLKWKKYLLAKGCNRLLKDNPYLAN